MGPVPVAHAEALHHLVDDELHEGIAQGLNGARVQRAAHVPGRLAHEQPVQQVLGRRQLIGGDLFGEGGEEEVSLHNGPQKVLFFGKIIV